MGPEGTSRETLLNEETLTAAVNALYQKFMVRVIDVDYRVPLHGATADSKAVTKEDTELSPDGVVRGRSIQTVSRLKMRETPKIILEALLGTMVLLAGIAYRLVRIRGVLPQSPYPITSSMALFEGSRLLGFSDEHKAQRTHIDGDEQLNKWGDRQGRGEMAEMAEMVKGKCFRLVCGMT